VWFLAGKMTVQERKTVKKDSNERKEEFSVNFETTFLMDWNREGANHSVGRVQCPPAGSWREDRMSTRPFILIAIFRSSSRREKHRHTLKGVHEIRKDSELT